MTINSYERTQEVYIDGTDRPYYTDIASLCNVEGYYRFGISSNAVNACVFKIMEQLQYFKVDEVVTAVGVVFMLMMWRFGFRYNTFLTYIDTFLKAQDEKIEIIAAMRMFHTHWQVAIKRYEKIKFKNSVRIQ